MAEAKGLPNLVTRLAPGQVLSHEGAEGAEDKGQG